MKKLISSQEKIINEIDTMKKTQNNYQKMYDNKFEDAH